MQVPVDAAPHCSGMTQVPRPHNRIAAEAGNQAVDGGLKAAARDVFKQVELSRPPTPVEIERRHPDQSKRPRMVEFIEQPSADREQLRSKIDRLR